MTLTQWKDGAIGKSPGYYADSGNPVHDWRPVDADGNRWRRWDEMARFELQRVEAAHEAAKGLSGLP